MAPILSFVLLFLSAVTALPELEARDVNTDSFGLVHPAARLVSKRDGVLDSSGLMRPAGLEKRAFANTSKKVDECEKELRRNSGQYFCSAYLNYYPSTKTKWTTKTITENGYFDPVRLTKTSTRRVTKTATNTIEVTETVTDFTATSTITAEPLPEETVPPTEQQEEEEQEEEEEEGKNEEEPAAPTVTIARRANTVPLPKYLRNKYQPAAVTSACHRVARPAKTKTVIKTRTWTEYNRQTVFRTRTVTKITRKTTQVTSTVSTTTVEAVATSTVPHPCDVPANTYHRVTAAGILYSDHDIYYQVHDVSARQCCIRCWTNEHDGAPTSCNGWLHFPKAMDHEGRPDPAEACMIAAKPGTAETTGESDTCPTGAYHFTILRDEENGHDYNLAGVGPCGTYDDTVPAAEEAQMKA